MRLSLIFQLDRESAHYSSTWTFSNFLRFSRAHCKTSLSHQVTSKARGKVVAIHGQSRSDSRIDKGFCVIIIFWESQGKICLQHKREICSVIKVNVKIPRKQLFCVIYDFGGVEKFPVWCDFLVCEEKNGKRLAEKKELVQLRCAPWREFCCVLFC